MKITDSIFKRPNRIKKTSRLDENGQQKTAKVSGGWFYRIRYITSLGEPKSAERGPFSSKNGARDARDIKVRELEASDGQISTGERMTFNQLADRCLAEFYKPAVIRAGRKIAGVRSHLSAKISIDNLKAYFGKRLINSISRESISQYKEHRTSQSVRSAKSEKAKLHKVQISTVNRELAFMRKMMRYAHREGWALRDIFYNAQMIDTTNEKAREVTLSVVDEERLLAACTGDRKVPYVRNRKGKEEHLTTTIVADNPRLRAMIILALDSGMRRGEIFKLRWEDVNFQDGYIRILGTHTKTEKERLAPLSDRVREQLENIRPLSQGDRPFPFVDIKRAFTTAVRLAGIKELRFHDLRRTFVTRQLSNGVSPMIVAKIAGHSQLQTTMKHYTGVGIAEIQQVTAQINAVNSAAAEQTAIQSELVN